MDVVIPGGPKDRTRNDESINDAYPARSTFDATVESALRR
jgi:hypothetical protein